MKTFIPAVSALALALALPPATEARAHEQNGGQERARGADGDRGREARRDNVRRQVEQRRDDARRQGGARQDAARRQAAERRSEARERQAEARRDAVRRQTAERRNEVRQRQAEARRTAVRERQADARQDAARRQAVERRAAVRDRQVEARRDAVRRQVDARRDAVRREVAADRRDDARRRAEIRRRVDDRRDDARRRLEDRRREEIRRFNERPRPVYFRPWTDRGLIAGCPPGLARKGNGCLPPGQARRLARERVRYDYGRYDYVWDRRNDYRYRYDDGYLYRYNPQGSLLGWMPALGGALGLGSLWPAQYRYEPAPTYYVTYYELPERYDYRYADGVLYGLDPQTQAISQVAALLTGQQWTVGQPMPAGYDVYNVPYGYRDRYYDTPDRWYRYNDGYVYQVDPTTQLVQAVVQLLA